MIVVTTSCAPTVALSTPGIPAHTAPAAIPPSSTMGSRIGDGRGLRPSPKLSLCRNVRGRGQCAALDLAQDLVQLGLQLWRHSEVVDRVTGTLIGDAEGQRSGLELVVDDVLDRRVGRDVNLLEGAGDDGRVSVLLVGVDADAVDAGLAGLLQHAQPAAPCDLEEDVRVCIHLALGHTLALGRVGEVV